uniref:Predicted protein n=1 Tax=Hordeum vulgare subsp. vulgare TaxID=112509 RepID=F2D3D2_HORVV|nr:predicted protein [Hordeum vulgare subsp. vulgare]
MCVRRQAAALGAAWPKDAATGVAVHRGTWPRGRLLGHGLPSEFTLDSIDTPPWRSCLRRLVLESMYSSLFF